MTGLLSLPSELLVDDLLPLLDPLSLTMLRSSCPLFYELIPLSLKMVRTGSFRQSRIVQKAARLGYIGIISWAVEQGCRWSSLTCAIAAGAGRFELLKWLRREGCPWDEYTCSYALLEGHVEICKWALEQGCRHPYTEQHSAVIRR